MAVMDILIQAQDQASDVMEGIGETGKKTGNWLEENWGKVAVAGGVAGAAMEGMARKQAPLTEQTKRLSGSIGITEGAMRDLAIETADVTLPLDDVLDLMEIGVQRGLEGEEALQRFAEQMDFVGDATGLSAQAIAESSVALEHAGISADNISEAYDAFGYITENTTSTVEDFNRFVGRAGKELGDNTPHVNDMAAALGALEDEGYDSQLAQRELQSALRETDGDMGKALETLGVSEDEFGKYTDAVEGSREVLERNAEAHEESYTTMQRLQHRAEELQYQYGDLTGVIGDFAPLMMGLGPIIKGVSAAKGLLAKVSMKAMVPAIVGATKAAWAFTAALLANPIVWIVALIVALGAAIYLLWQNWDEVSEWLADSWEWIKDKAGDMINGIIEWFKELPGRLWEWLQDAVERIEDWAEETRDRAIQAGKDLLERFIGFVAELPGKLWSALTDAIGRARRWRDDMRNRAIEAGRDLLERFIGFVRDLPGRLWGALSDAIRRMWDWRNDMIDRAKDAGQNLLDSFINTITGLPGRLWNVLKDAAWELLRIGSRLWNNAREAGSRIWEGFKSGLGIRSPSLLEQAMQDIIDKSHEMPDEVAADFDKVSGMSPSLDVGTQSQQRTATSRAELTITHRFEDVPEHLDESELAEAMAKAFKRPDFRRLMSRLGFENIENRTRPQGG